MVNHTAVLLALRARLLGLQVTEATTDALYATETGFGRDAGSFLTDGFAVGMEVASEGFLDNTPRVIEQVTDAEIVTRGARTPEQPHPDVIRRVFVGLPLRRAWENVEFTPTDGEWFVNEQYLPGPVTLSAGNFANGELDAEPVYVVRIGGLPGTGVAALFGVADAILAHFWPGMALSAPDGHTIRVRGDTAPYRGQMFTQGAHAVIDITIPAWVRTSNNAP